MTTAATRRIGLQFDDNLLAPQLFGEHGIHLNMIEEHCDVEIASRGNELVITGTKPNLKAAQRTLDALWERLLKNLDVGPDEVSAALRLGQEDIDPDARKLALEAFKKPQINVQKGAKVKHVTARSPNQAKYLESMEKYDVIFGLGPAGTGKTFLAVAQAVKKLQEGHVDRLILCRPAVEAGERLGFLPGDLQEKVDPYLRPIYDSLNDMMPAEQVVQRLANGQIEVAPLAFMRGRTLSNAFIILDEAQNTTPTQMKMVLTRLGEGSTMVINGDPSQVDLPKGQKSGLSDAQGVLKRLKDVSFIQFKDSDVVRHNTVAKIIRAYDRADKKKARTATQSDTHHE